MTAVPDRLSPALERTLGNFSGILRRVCWRYHISGADVDELVQEVRIRLWRAHGTQEGADEQIRGIPASYLHRTALSAAIDLLRRRRARRSDRMVAIDDEWDGMPEVAGPDQDLAESELADQVERAIEAIPPSRRAVVRMHLKGHSREEIAKLMGWTEAKTRNLLYRGLADVRERLEAQGVKWPSQT
jgi:RNA polymerase sigma factor (sigma-70 family)